MYSIALGPRFLKWKMLSLSGPNALLFLQLLIVLVTMSAVKVSAISIAGMSHLILIMAKECVNKDYEWPLVEILHFEKRTLHQTSAI